MDKRIKNIIFDFGGIIVDLDKQAAFMLLRRWALKPTLISMIMCRTGCLLDGNRRHVAG